MSFNVGFMCPSCGPIEKATSKTKNKIQVNTCPVCETLVQAWKRPLNERAGRCRNCGNGAFTLAIHKRELLRKCKACNEVYNTDTQQTIRKGDAGNERK